MKKIYKQSAFLILLFSLHFSVFSQLVVNNTMTATQLVQNVLLGPGISAFNITSSAAGTGVSIGQFTNGNTTNLGITSGVVMSTGSIFNIPNTAGGQASTDNISGSDAQLATLAGASIMDATWLQFDFIPTVPLVTFRYVFGSEEYPEYVNAGFNDVFGFFITGPNPGGGTYTNVNLALIPSTTLPVSIDNVNSGSYSQYYTDNQGTTIVFDGFTHVLTATCQVTPCQTYHIKLAVGDAGDAIYDSGIFLEGGSFSGGNSISLSSTSSNPTLSNDAIEGCSDAIVSFTLAAPLSSATTINYTVGGTATNGVDYTMIPTSVTIPAGSTFTTLTIDPVLDALAEGTETVQLIVATPPCGFDTVLVNIANYTPLVITAPPDVAVCDGDQLVLTATTTGGLSPLNFLWNNGTANAANTVYPTGVGTTPTYTVTVTDACNNQPSDNTIVTVNNCSPCSTFAGVDDKTCGLTFNLQATTLPGDYNTQWSSVTPGAIFSNLSSPTSSVTVPGYGTYSFVWTVTNVAGLTCNATVTIIFAPTPTSTFSVVNPNCFGENAVVTYTGNAPAGAIYTWNFGGGVATPGIGQGPHNVLYGSAGNYSIQLSVDDLICNSITTTQSVNIPQLLDLNVIAGSVLCSGGTTSGTVNVNVTGGISPLIYTWSNGPTPPTVAGTYTVTVTDLHSCTDTSTFTITEPQAIVVTQTPTNLNCNNDLSGAAIVSVSGGTLPYVYSWSNNISLNAPNQSNIQAGLYVVSVTDDNGCLVTQSITITQPPAITINTPNITNVSCFGGNNGSAILNANGGTFPLSYSLNGGPLQPTGNFSALVAGSYTLGVIDAHNCILSSPFEITEPTQVTLLSQTFTNITCFGQHNGTITANANGGTGTLHYSIGGTSQIAGTFTNLYPGNYLVSVTDDNGCSVTGTPMILSQPPVLSIDSVASVNLTCFVSNDGSAFVSVSGGTAPFLYAVGSLVQTSGIYNNVPAGSFIVIITDANGCSIQTNPINITQPPQLIITSQNATAIPCFGNPATISVIATGGTNPLTYSLNGNTPTANGVYTGLSGGIYSVTIRDSHNCTITSNTFTIVEPPLLMITDSTFTNITCNGVSNGIVSVTASGGTLPLQYSIVPGVTQNSNTFSNLDIGSYTLTVTDNNGCRDYTSFTLTEPAAMVSTATSTNVRCNGGSDGSASISTTGGTLPYNINWSNGATTTNVINLGVGIYFISVTDANNCSTSDTVLITQPSQPHITSSADTSICKNSQAILVTHATGGTQPYTYLWNGVPSSMSTNTPTLSINSTYSVFIIDANGCISDTAETYIGIIPDVILDVYTPDDSVCVGTPVNIYWTVTGGDGGPYTIYDQFWETPPFIVTPLYTRSYTFYAKDYHCNIFGRDTLTIYTMPLPSATISADDYKGCQPFTVNFSVETNPVCTGFLWDFGEEDALSYTKFPQHVYNYSGVYDVGVTVTSIDGCTNNTTMQQLITVYPKPEARFDYTPDVVSIIKPQIFFTNYSTSQTTNMWSFGDGDSSLALNPDHFYRNTGQFNVVLAVETSYRCKDTSIAVIVVKDEIAVYIPTAFSPDNDGINDVFLVKGHGIDPATFFLSIYDRWGELIFTSDKIERGWDGSVKKGAKGTSDSYVWMVSFKDLNGKKYVKSGIVTMIR